MCINDNSEYISVFHKRPLPSILNWTTKLDKVEYTETVMLAISETFFGPLVSSMTIEDSTF